MKLLNFVSVIAVLCVITSCNNTNQKTGNQADVQSEEMKIVVEALQTSDNYNISTPSKGLFSKYCNDKLGITASVIDSNVFFEINPDKLLNNFGIDCSGCINSPYQVQNLSGKCLGLFVGDIGQDTRPILCMLMDDGHIEILDIFNALQFEVANYGVFTSGPIPNIEGIVSFENGGGGPYEMDGETAYSYTTIYAINKDGEKEEIQLFERSGSRHLYIEHNNTIEDDMLYLSPDWKFIFSAGWYMSELSYKYLGHFRELSHNEDYDTFNLQYELEKHIDYSDFENIKESDVKMAGQFTLNIDQDAKWTINSKRGLTFGSKLGDAVIFTSPRMPEEKNFIDKVRDDIFALPEAKGLSLILDSEPTENTPYYLFTCGENHDDHFVTLYWFHVYQNPYEIKVYDVVTDREMTIEEWRAENN